jgi:hypothetical protein
MQHGGRSLWVGSPAWTARSSRRSRPRRLR